MEPEKREEASEEMLDDEDIALRFPNPQTDSRLRTPRGSELPDAPQVHFDPPQTEAATGGKPHADLNLGPAGKVSGSDLRGIGVGYSIGYYLVTSILIGTGLGYLADRFVLHTAGTPWGLIIGFLAGVVTGFVQMIRIAEQLSRENR